MGIAQHGHTNSKGYFKVKKTAFITFFLKNFDIQK